MAGSQRHKKAGNSLASLSVGELRREIARRHRGVARLERKRTRLLHRIEAIDGQLRMHGAATGVGQRGIRVPREKNAKTLVESLIDTLKGKTMGVTEVAEAVKRAGYKTNAPSFRTIVNQALVASGKFKRVSRGQYTAK